jgi:hypothetical protein
VPHPVATEPAATPAGTPHSTARRFRLRLLAALAAALVIPLTLAVVDGMRIAHEVKAGRAAFARVAREGLSPQAPLRSLAEAGVRRFDNARLIAQRSPWLSAWAHVPILGRPARWLRVAAATTSSLSREAAGAIGRIEPRLRAKGASAGRLDLLKLVETEFIRLRTAVEGARLPSTGGFLPPVDAAGRELRADLERLRARLTNGIVAARGMRSFLRGPSTYAVLAANNAEMRAGGMPLQVGLLRTNGGRTEAGGFRSTGDLTLHRKVAIPPQIRALYGWLYPGTEWRNVGSSPNFPAVGPVYAAMAQRSGLGSVDGVFQIDVLGVRALLEVAGPVMVGGHRYGPGNVERLMMHDLYAAFGGEQVERRHEFSQLAAAVFQAVNARDARPDVLVRALRSAALGRHLLAWSSRPIEEQGWRSLGIDGSLVRDGLMLTVQNHTGNKLDWFLRPSMTLRVEERHGAWRRLHLKIRIENPTPAGQPKYIAGDGALVPPGDHRALVAVYLPGWATDIEMPGRTIVLVGPDGPSRVIGTRLDIARGTTAMLEVVFSVPPGVHWIVLIPSGRATPVPLRVGEHVTDDKVRRSVPL